MVSTIYKNKLDLFLKPFEVPIEKLVSISTKFQQFLLKMLFGLLNLSYHNSMKVFLYDIINFIRTKAKITDNFLEELDDE